MRKNMRRDCPSYQIFLTVLLLVGVSIICQGQRYGFPPNSRLESSEGQPNQPDVIAHKFASKGTNFKCTLIESHPKRPEDDAACVLRFENGKKEIVGHGKSTQAEKDGEVYLECSGDKPTRCVVGLWVSD